MCTMGAVFFLYVITVTSYPFPVESRAASCTLQSPLSSRHPKCPPPSHCPTCPTCPPGHVTSFRPEVPVPWHGQLNDSATFDLLQLPVYILDFSSMGIQSLRPGLFEGAAAAVDELRLEWNNLTTLQDGSFSGLHSLRFVNASHNRLSTVAAWAFDTEEREWCLQMVDLSHNRLVVMDAWPFSDSRHGVLMLFDLSYNAISSFRNTPKLTMDADRKCGLRSKYRDKVIDLQWNNFTSMEEFLGERGLKVFKPDGNLNLPLDLYVLHLQIAQNDWLCDCAMYRLAQATTNLVGALTPKMPNLLPICRSPEHLRGARIVDVSLDVFVCPVSIDCPRSCLCQYSPHLGRTVVDCEGSGLTSLPVSLPAGDLSVNLAGNIIDALDNRNYLSRVKEMNISGNIIDHVSEEALLQLQTVTSLDLRGNALRTVPAALSAFSSASVRLGNNPLECSCSMTWLELWADKDADLQCFHNRQSVELESLSQNLRCGKSSVVGAAVGISVGVLAVVVAILVVVVLFARRDMCLHPGRLLSRKGGAPYSKPDIDEAKGINGDCQL